MVTKLFRVAMLLLGALGLFAAGVAGTLAARGKLNRTYLAPVLGLEGAAGDKSSAHATASVAPSPALGAVLDRAAQPAAGAHSGAAADAKDAGSSSVLPRILLPSPFSAEEMTELLDELERTREVLKERVGVVDREHKDLDLVRADLNRRWDELDRREEMLEEEARQIAAERGELDTRSVILKEAEIENVKNLAAGIEKMGAAPAADLLQEMTQERVAKILSFMKPRERGKILAAMPPEFASKVSDRLLGLLMPTSGGARPAGADRKEGP